MSSLKLVLILLQVALFLQAGVRSENEAGENENVAETFLKDVETLEAQTPEPNPDTAEGEAPDSAEQEQTDDKVGNLEVLCRNGKAGPFLLSQFDSLVAQIPLLNATETANCMPRTLEALEDFSKVIKEDEENICTMRKVELYESFYVKYVHHILLDKSFKKLPKSLLKFVLAYGMQLANACKWNMYNELTGQVRDLLSADDFEKIAKYIHRKSPIVKMIGSTQYPDELFLPAELLGPELVGEQSEWVMREGTARTNLESLQRMCQYRFQPIYEPIMLPLARLARLGFSFRDQLLEKLLKRKDIKEEMGKWPRVVFLCELIKNIKLMTVEEAEAKKNELQMVEENIVDMSDDETLGVSSLDAQTSPAKVHVEAVKFEREFKHELGDLILDSNDKQLCSAVSGVKTFMGARWKLNMRQMSNFVGILSQHAKRFRIHSVVAKLAKYFWRQQDFWFGYKTKKAEIQQGLERQLDPELKYEEGETLTKKQKYVRMTKRGLYLVWKTTFTSILVLASLCLVFCPF